MILLYGRLEQMYWIITNIWHLHKLFWILYCITFPNFSYFKKFNFISNIYLTKQIFYFSRCNWSFQWCNGVNCWKFNEGTKITFLWWWIFASWKSVRMVDNSWYKECCHTGGWSIRIFQPCFLYALNLFVLWYATVW